MSYVNPVPLKKDGFNTPEMQRIYKMLLKSLKFPCKNFHDWDVRPRCGYFFSGCQWYGSDVNKMAGFAAFMSTYGEYDEELAGISRDELREMAIRTLRYACFTHDTGPEDCVRVHGPNKLQSGTKWGGNHVSFGGHRGRFFQGTQVGANIVDFGFAAWALWDFLDEETRQMAYNVVTDYAERWADYEPRDGVYYDTQAEENAWTANGVYAAAVIFRDDPRAEKWRRGAIRWMMDSAAVPSDRLSDEKLPNGKALRECIEHITLHPDFSTENHGILHPDYLDAPIAFRSIMGMFTNLAGEEELIGVRHNWKKIYDNMLKLCAAEDGGVIPIQSQDWWYFKVHEFLLVHAATRLMFDEPYAARLEQLCLNVLEKAQSGHPNGTFLDNDPGRCMVDSNPYNYQTLADSEPTIYSFLWKTYLWHMCAGQGVEPVSREDYERQVETVHKFPFGGSVIKRTPDAFSTCAFRNCAMAYVLPKDKTWVITAPPCSTFGEMRFDDGCPEDPGLSNQSVIRAVDDVRVYDDKDAYAVSMSIDRGLGRVRQDVAFVSLPDGNAVYFQRVRALKDCKLNSFTSGLVGVRNENYRYLPEYAKGYRVLSLSGGISQRMEGYIGEKDAVYDYDDVQYAAIDDKMLYLLRGSNGVRYIGHHCYLKWKGIEDFLILNNYDGLSMKAGEELPLFAAAYLPNRGIEGAENIEFNVSCAGSGDAAIFDGRLVYSTVRGTGGEIDARFNLPRDEIPLFEGRISYKKGVYTWSASVPPRGCGYKDAVARVSGDMDFDAVVLPDETVLIRYADEDAYHVLYYR